MNMMLNMGIADAYGFGFEYAPADFVAKHNDGETFAKNPKWPDHIPGHYSDDTQMSIALAEYLLSGAAPNTTQLACKFVSVFKRDPRAGYAGSFYKLIQEVRDGYELVDRLVPMSDKSGGAMRAAPCGLLPTFQEARDVAMWQASVTHATMDGMHAAVGAALMVWWGRRLTDVDKLPTMLSETCGFLHKWDVAWTGPVGAKGLDAVHAAFTSIVGSNGTLSDILKRSVAWTGDVDTVAAIAMAAASVMPCIKQDLPDTLYRNLEGGKYGWRYLKALDAKLEKAFPIPVKKPAKSDLITDLFDEA